MSTIFVQIASYRDPQLKHTLRDCLAKARHPDNLSISVIRQFHPDDKWDNIAEFENDKRITFINKLYSESKGVCWARSIVQQNYKNEEYTLQLDSHHRFVPNWDEELITMFNNLRAKGHQKPLITSYATGYMVEIEKDLPEEQNLKNRDMVPWRLVFDRFSPEGILHFRPEHINNHQEFKEPIPSRFLSGHFYFTLGIFNKEVLYDPNYYFYGEESSLAARAYTHGYDLFHPHKVILWHQYTRRNKIKHWDDCKDWSKYNQAAHDYNKKLFGIDGKPESLGIYGFGTVRSLQDYERYVGIEFSTRKVHKDTISKKDPPIIYTKEEDFQENLMPHRKYCLNVLRSKIPKDDFICWAVAFKDENNIEIYRQDADPLEIERVMNDKVDANYLQLWREFYSDKVPTKWIVWPQNSKKEWLPIIEGSL